MQIYKVTIRHNYGRPMFIVVNSIADIERVYSRLYPEGQDIISIELLDGEVIIDESVLGIAGGVLGIAGGVLGIAGGVK